MWDSKIIIAIASAAIGALLAFCVQRILAKRGRFSYTVTHSHIGISSDDAVFGTVRVTWNGSTVANLFVSTIELLNESQKDYDNVSVKVFTSDTTLLTERTEVVGSTRILAWTEDFARQLAVVQGGQASTMQRDIVTRSREFLIPTMNRGQIIRMTFLNIASSEKQPSLWLDIVHKGIKLGYRCPQMQILGVSRSIAGIVGLVIGLIFVGCVTQLASEPWIASTLSFIFGMVVVLPGALAVRVWRRVRDAVGD